MAAYASVISLKHTINGLLNSSSSSSSREILKFAYEEVKSLQQVLEGLNESGRSRSSMERVDALEGKIRDCTNKLEDFLEFHELKLLEEGVSGDEGAMRKEVSSFSETSKMMENEYMEELSRDDEDGDDDDANDDDDDGDSSVEMVGHSDVFTNFRNNLVDKMRPVDMCVCSYRGEEGTGRTITARTIYDELSRCGGEYFDCWTWVMVGPTKLKQVLISIIAQVVDDHGDDHISCLDESELSKYLYKALENRRYMIGLGDVDDPELVDFLKRTSFPDQRTGSLVLITTASKDVSRLADREHNCGRSARMFEEATWPILHSVVRGFDPISPEMEEAGKQIIKNCGCLTVAAVKTMLFLFKTDKTVEEWRKIAADKENPIFTVVDEI